jgi:6-phosphogluconolactonase
MTYNSKLTGYVGTYTKGESKGIYRFTLDTELSEIQKVEVAATLGNPTYITISPDNKYLYSVIKDGESGGVAAYKLDGTQEDLQFINNQFSEGASPCHVSLANDKNYLFSANYHKGTVECYPVNTDNGAIGTVLSVVEHKGSGPDARQEKPHTHYAGFTPDEKYVIAVDLGTDKLITYKLDGTLSEVSTLEVQPGSGPRHIVFHPNKKYAYLMTEFSSEVLTLEYDSKDGSFKEVQSISTLPKEFSENNQGSAIHISNDGRFVYAGNRGHNSIAIFNTNEDGGILSFVEHTSTEGNWPRDFALDPTEKFLIASNQESSNLVLFARNKETGKLTLLQKDINVPYPVCVKFLN